MKDMLDKKENEKLKTNMNKELMGILRGATMGITQDSELMKMLKKWVEGREKYHDIEQKKKMMNTFLDLDVTNLKTIILKLQHIDRNLRELKKIKRGGNVKELKTIESDKLENRSQQSSRKELSSRNNLAQKLQNRLNKKGK